ncbi:MAG: DUF1552 domain-containing protein [Myxococcota bacterium]
MHLLNKFSLNRRHMLRGILGGSAVAIGLPPLEAMLGTGRTAKAGGSDPLRFISFFFGNGVQLARFEPTSTGAEWSLSEQLQPLAPVKDHVTVCTGLRNNTGSQPITHHEGITTLSGYDYAPSNAGGIASDWGGPTIDQVIADIIAADVTTPIRSMQVGVTKFDSPIDNGTAAKALSARGEPGALTPLYPEQNPRLVWQNVFGEFEAPATDGELRLSVLDSVRADIQNLKGRLGAQDNVRVDAHLQNISELETKIAALPPACTLPGEPTHENSEANGQEDLTLVNQIMSELIAYAFTCDITRVASNLFCSVASEAFFSQDVGSSGTHHGHSHANDEGYNQNIQFIMSCLSQLMQTLEATQDLNGDSLLDSTLILATSEMSQGYTHSWQRIPMIIGGHGRGHLQHPGVHYQAIPQNNPDDDLTAAGNTTDVLLALARAFDPALPSVGAGSMISEAPLADILA